MKVAVFSDVQANVPAFETVIAHIERWGPDLVVMAGDLVNRGPSTRECVLRFDGLRRERGWLPVVGNHEVWVLRCGREAPSDPLDAEMRRFADWTYRQVADLTSAIADWPDHLCFHPAGSEAWVHVTHASMTSNREGISARTPDEVLDARLPEDVALFVTGHTHRPLTRHHRGIAILNVGSVGSPFDGDVRASYGQLTFRDGRWETHIPRLDYDRAAAERAFHDSGFLEHGGPLARIIFEEWRRADVIMPLWHRGYRDAVLAGEIGLAASVDALLASLG